MSDDKQDKVISSIKTEADDKKEEKPAPASTGLLSSLLEDMTAEANSAKAEIEAQLKAKEDAEKRAKEEEEAKLRQQLRVKLEEETRKRNDALKKKEKERRRQERARAPVAQQVEEIVEEVPAGSVVKWIIPFALVILALGGAIAYFMLSPKDTGGDMRAFYSQVKAGKWMAINHARNKQRELKIVDLNAEIKSMELKVSEADLESQTYKEKLENKKKELATLEESFTNMKDKKAKAAKAWEKYQSTKVKINTGIFKPK